MLRSSSDLISKEGARFEFTVTLNWSVEINIVQGSTMYCGTPELFLSRHF